jgi:hypothetical protein
VETAYESDASGAAQLETRNRERNHSRFMTRAFVSEQQRKASYAANDNRLRRRIVATFLIAATRSAPRRRRPTALAETEDYHNAGRRRVHIGH